MRDDGTMMTITGPDGITSEPFTLTDLQAATGKAKRMKPDPEFAEAEATAYKVTASELRQFIERFERLEEDRIAIVGHMKEVMAEAKGRGYCTATLRKLISLRKKSADELSEEEAILELYKSALGM